MENSQTLMNDEDLQSSNTKTIDDDDDDSDPEESSWTFYIQDFDCGGGGENNSSFSSDLVPDAASSASRKLSSNNNGGGNKLSFKWPRKGKGTTVNDDLEDTASSPVNSPKISYINQLTLKRNDKNVSDFNNQEKTNSNHNHNGLDILKGEIDYSELKKKGLCLVPVSMLAKYFG